MPRGEQLAGENAGRPQIRSSRADQLIKSLYTYQRRKQAQMCGILINQRQSGDTVLLGMRFFRALHDAPDTLRPVPARVATVIFQTESEHLRSVWLGVPPAPRSGSCT